MEWSLDTVVSSVLILENGVIGFFALQGFVDVLDNPWDERVNEKC